jgi:uncharacterized protein with beta-barrel porin domain
MLAIGVLLAARPGRAEEKRIVGPFQLVFHQSGETYGNTTASKSWSEPQIQAAMRAAQSWVERIGNTTTGGSIPLHLLQADLGVADPTTGGIVVGQSSNPLGETTTGKVGTLEEQVWRGGSSGVLAAPGTIVLNTNATMIQTADAASASLTASGKLQRVLAHEIGHSMGMYGTGIGGTFGGGPYTAYDNELRDANGNGPGPSFDSTSAVTWNGIYGYRAYGAAVPIYSPSTFLAGSSLYHIDILNQLMNYSLSNTSNAIRGASALEMAMYRDMGWQIDTSRFNTRTFADTLYDITNTDDLVAYATSGVALEIVNGGGSADNLRWITQSGHLAVGQAGSIGIGLWSNYNRLLNSGRITATGDYNAGIYSEGVGNRIENSAPIDVIGAEANGILVLGSHNQVFNTGAIHAWVTLDNTVGNAIQLYGGGAGNQVYLQTGSAIVGNIQTDAPAALSFGESTTSLGTGDAAFRLVFSDRIVGDWATTFWGGATALEKRDPSAAANQFTGVDVKSGATLTSAADMLVAGQVVVRSGGTLAGTSTITRPTGSSITTALLDSQAGATLRPGDVADSAGLPAKAIGTLTVAGDAISNGSVAVDLTWQQSPDVAQDADRLVVQGGTAAINSSARGGFAFSGADPDRTDRYAIDRRYTIVSTDAAGSLAIGTRPTVEDDLVGRRMILRTDQCTSAFSATGQNYYAYVGRDVPFASLGRTANQQAVGGYLDRIKQLDDGTFGSPYADLQWIRDTLDLMPGETDVALGLNALGGEIYASLGTIGSQHMFLAYHRLAQRVRDNIFRDPDNPPEHETKQGESDNSVRMFSWATGHGAGSAIRSDGNAGAYDYGAGGVQVGFGYHVQDQLSFGLFYDYDGLSLTDAFNNQGGAAVHEFGGFTSFHPEVGYLLVAAGGGLGTYEVTRTLALENPLNRLTRQFNGDHSGSEWGVYGELGTSFGTTRRALRPFLGLMYSGLRQNAFTETGGGVANLSVDPSTTDALRVLLGAQLDLTLPLPIDTVWTLRGTWMHETLDDTCGLSTAGFSQIPGSSFTVRGIDLGRDWAVVGSEIRIAAWRNIVHLYGNYDLVVNSRQDLHTAGGGLEYVW